MKELDLEKLKQETFKGTFSWSSQKDGLVAKVHSAFHKIRSHYLNHGRRKYRLEGAEGMNDEMGSWVRSVNESTEKLPKLMIPRFDPAAIVAKLEKEDEQSLDSPALPRSIGGNKEHHG